MKLSHWTAAISLVTIVLFVSFQVYGQSSEDLFLDKCANCHGKDGAGQTVQGKKLKVRDMRSAEVQKFTDAQMIEVITKGKNDMDGFAKELSEKQTKDLVVFLRAFATKK